MWDHRLVNISEKSEMVTQKPFHVDRKACKNSKGMFSKSSPFNNGDSESFKPVVSEEFSREPKIDKDLLQKDLKLWLLPNRT